MCCTLQCGTLESNANDPHLRSSACSRVYIHLYALHGVASTHNTKRCRSHSCKCHGFDMKPFAVTNIQLKLNIWIAGFSLHLLSLGFVMEKKPHDMNVRFVMSYFKLSDTQLLCTPNQIEDETFAGPGSTSTHIGCYRPTRLCPPRCKQAQNSAFGCQCAPLRVPNWCYVPPHGFIHTPIGTK